MSNISNDDLLKAASSARFVALSQLGAAITDFHNWDAVLVRDQRLLVPVDVNALVVRQGDEAMVRLPFRSEAGDPPNPDDPGSVREPGVHLMWTVPATFGRGTIVTDPVAPDDPSRSTLHLRPLPDRWVVLRLAVPVGATAPLVRGWVLRADDGSVTPLTDYPTVGANTKEVGPPVPADQLNAQVGGPGWMECFDAALGRLSMHDPLDDLPTLAPNGIVGDALTYVVGGWWDRVENDPLDGVGSIFGYHDLLRQLGWDDPDHPEPEAKRSRDESSSVKVERTFNIEAATRYATSSPAQVEYQPSRSGFVTAGSKVATLIEAPTRATLLHGRIHGVPWQGAAQPDDRPPISAVGVAFGPTSPSVSALLASGAMVQATTPAQQADAERLLAAFQSGLLARISEPDVWPEIDHYEHLQGFGSLPGGIEATDRFRELQRASTDPGSGSRLGRRSNVQYEMLTVDSALLWSTQKYFIATAQSKAAAPSRAATSPPRDESQRAVQAPGVRTAPRPAVPFTYPVSPVLAVNGAGRRIRAAERDEADGVLRVRTADQLDPGTDGVVTGRDLLASIGSGALPDEMLSLAREALMLDPFLADWRASLVRGDPIYVRAAGARLRSEAVVNYAYYAGDHATLSKATGTPVTTAVQRQVAVEGLMKHSSGRGVWTHAEGVTMWGQPWRPQFCEWTAELELADLAQLLAGEWTLGEQDLHRDLPFIGAETLTLTGRSPLHPGIAKGLAAAVDKWLDQERERNKTGPGIASPQTEQAMATLSQHLADLDILSVSLDGVREQLLGLRYDRGLIHDTADVATDGTARALAVALPRLVAAGRFRVASARLVDSWGRLLDLPVERAAVVSRAADPDAGPATIQLPPRLNAGSRVHLRLVDPLPTDNSARIAVVDQVDAALMVNPVAGFMLPDHIDEALELFAADGTPLGQLSHDAFGDAVFWEGAPGRLDIGPAAGPLDDVDPAHQRLGWIAAGLVRSDAEIRQALPGRPEVESPLSAMLRAIDTTLWSVDPFGALGTEHIAGLVGRPIAVVTARLTLDVPVDLDDVVYATGMSRQDRQQAFADLAAVPFAIRLGSLLRSDDGLVGYYVDDDFAHLYVIDRQVTKQARESGRCRGQLGVEGSPTSKEIDNPYVVDAGYVTIRHGQTRRLTLLMHPGGKVHVTSGIAPRSALALARDWVQPGLSVMAPSVRVGPLLIDADKVRLPKVSSFPADQLFTRRENPGAWRDDPILAATQTAYLPDQPSMLQEGWIRINPNPTPEGGS